LTLAVVAWGNGVGVSSSGWTNEQLFSSVKSEWSTPLELFEILNAEFSFVLDAAALPHNALLPNYITPERDALACDWHELAAGGPVWLNPPYGRGVGDWVRKSYRESLKGSTVVVLTFVRTDTAWWHNWATKAAEVRLIKGRLYFRSGDDSLSGAAPAPSCLLVFSERLRQPQFKTVRLPRGAGK